MDTITHRNNPNRVTKMVSMFDLHPSFTIESVKARNVLESPSSKHNTCDKQNDDNTIKCFMNSSGEDLRQQI